MTLEDLKGKKIVLAGMGVNHLALAEYLRVHGVVFDVIEKWRNSDELLGKIDDYDIVFRSPGLPYFSPPISQAKNNGVKIYSQTKLFFDLCPAQIIGVTGTKGKGTTATLIARVLEKAGRKVWLAGNIGLDPFSFLDQIRSEDWVVLELSSFQIQDLHKSPRIAVVLAVTADHLDHHRSLSEYIEAKSNLVRYQGAGDHAVLNYDSDVTRGFARLSGAKVHWVSISQTVKPGCFVQNESIFCDDFLVMLVSEVNLPGRFNLQNVCAAVAACWAAGVCDPEVIRAEIRDFEGLPHRLERVGVFGDVDFYDDSASTNPDTTVAALGAFARPMVLIVGGSEKNADYSALGQAIASNQVKAIVPIGVTGAKIAKLSRAAGFAGKISQDKFETMSQIVRAAKEFAIPGDVVLLSPASASFGMFRDYKERGDLFKAELRKARV